MTDRLQMLEDNHGIEAARDFACRTYKLYRAAVLNKRHYASNRTYRPLFIREYLKLKRYCFA